MEVSKKALEWAAAKAALSDEQTEKLWRELHYIEQQRPKFTFVNVLYYFGATLVISAMAWFVTDRWDTFSGIDFIAIALVYAAGLGFAGRYLWFERDEQIPGGLLFTAAVCMAPMAIYGIEKATGWWPQGSPGTYRDYHHWIKGSWFLMEIGTIAAAAITLRWVKFPFLVVPIALTLWYMSMDLTPLLFGKNSYTPAEAKLVSVAVGLIMLIVAVVIDRKLEPNYASWLYLFGLVAFWGGLSMMESQSEFRKFLYCLLNIGLIGIGVLLRRPIFAFFGGVGVFYYLMHLTYRVFNNSVAFPFALSGIGVLLIILGLQFQKRRVAIEIAVAKFIPPALRELLPPERR